jgi:epoxyqueuosine reductase
LPNKKFLESLANQQGFDAIGIASAQLPEMHATNLQAFLAAGYHGQMLWMEERAHQRSSPHHLWPEAKSAIVLAQNYGPEANPLPALQQAERGVISCYAGNLDYHDVIKKKLKNFARALVAAHPCEVKVFVDTAPVMEKPLAALAGIGWQGKHSCIVSREYGSWLFLGVILTTLELPPDIPEINHCGSCTRCLDICPTQAFPAPGQIDARRCISYLTIEHHGMIDRELRSKMGNRIYGCDDCLAICPWNKFAQTASESAYYAREELQNPPLSELLLLDDTTFRTLFRKSPIKRIGRNRFLRNVLIAAGNSQHGELMPGLVPLLSDDDAVIRATAVWSLSRLAIKEDFLALASRFMPNEIHPTVLEEWNSALEIYRHD